MASAKRLGYDFRETVKREGFRNRRSENERVWTSEGKSKIGSDVKNVRIRTLMLYLFGERRKTYITIRTVLTTTLCAPPPRTGSEIMGSVSFTIMLASKSVTKRR